MLTLLPISAAIPLWLVIFRTLFIMSKGCLFCKEPEDLLSVHLNILHDTSSLFSVDPAFFCTCFVNIMAQNCYHHTKHMPKMPCGTLTNTHDNTLSSDSAHQQRLFAIYRRLIILSGKEHSILSPALALTGEKHTTVIRTWEGKMYVHIHNVL